MHNKNKNKGILLIICLILLVVLSGMGFAVVSITINNNKAAQYTNAKMEAQQKADAIANYAYKYLDNSYQIAHLAAGQAGSTTTDDLNPSASQPTIAPKVWSGVPSTLPTGVSLMATISNTTIKQWWRTQQNYQAVLADKLNALPNGTYAGSNGSQPSDVVDAFVVYQGAVKKDSDGYNTRTLTIVAYATDSKGQTAATREKQYVWTQNCIRGTAIQYSDGIAVLTQNCMNNGLMFNPLNYWCESEATRGAARTDVILQTEDPNNSEEMFQRSCGYRLQAYINYIMAISDTYTWMGSRWASTTNPYCYTVYCCTSEQLQPIVCR